MMNSIDDTILAYTRSKTIYTIIIIITIIIIFIIITIIYYVAFSLPLFPNCVSFLSNLCSSSPMVGTLSFLNDLQSLSG
uniref:Uncharacterized protein n=1 Tax=Schistosoma mansoni TaxID=6183 RepID=Q9XY37_SCHMA|nr:unknown [Schistosoma mansoni]